MLLRLLYLLDLARPVPRLGSIIVRKRNRCVLIIFVDMETGFSVVLQVLTKIFGW